ncbi:MAG: rhodanese-like domain-containing protein [Bacteroidales bacterium]|nr:rhodanese-like domain-containing protein [Bacteroidales bacterium]
MAQNKQIKVYVFLTAVFMVLGIIMIFIPDKEVEKEVSPHVVIKIYNHGNAYYTTDQVAKLIMDGNPILQLVDVRSEEEFSKFSLKNAINIPLEELIDKDKKGNYVWRDYLKPEKKITVFYSNGDMTAAKAWTLATRLRFENIFILDGGLNNWIETIIKPVEPQATTATPEDYNVYQFRKAASMYFGGATANVAPTSVKSTVKKTVVKKKKDVEEEGGC